MPLNLDTFQLWAFSKNCKLHERTSFAMEGFSPVLADIETDIQISPSKQVKLLVYFFWTRGLAGIHNDHAHPLFQNLQPLLEYHMWYSAI